jgi:hypothetical protein
MTTCGRVQGVGEQVWPRKKAPPTLTQELMNSGAVQLVPMQHAPTVHTPGVQAMPADQTLGVEQARAVVCVQPPVLGSQQAPCPAAQGLGEQVLVAPWKVFGLAHPLAMASEQAPCEVQHAPRWAAHRVGVHVVPSPWKVLVTVQPPLVVMLQKPAPEQQAPFRALHGVGEQVLPAPRKLLAPVQPEPVVTLQAPMPVQQAPTIAAHGVGETVQVVPAPLNTPLHARPTVKVHDPMVEQQAPRRAEQTSVGEQVEPTPLKVPKAEAWHPLVVVSVQPVKPFGQQAPFRASHGVVAQVLPLPR